MCFAQKAGFNLHSTYHRLRSCAFVEVQILDAGKNEMHCLLFKPTEALCSFILTHVDANATFSIVEAKHE